MYKTFFDLKERPFQLVPNPAYLYLSRSHEEALAHLSYAVSQGDGFVEITGEVGTGKTTLCRSFLENLDEDTEAAYIFNPKLDSLQLLKTVNDEFGIDSDDDNSKDLIDRLNAFLIDIKTEGKKALLIIDEAQNLNSDVLEQLRLVSNLETTTSKLLQIILVGQPELGEKLDSYELRQIGQRITLSCHLTPLTFKETKEYIQHRMHIASRKSGVQFDWSALLSIYRYSGGIPRLINIVCDRSLLNAYVLGQHKISGRIVKAAIRELSGKGERIPLQFLTRKTAVLVLLVLCIFLLFNAFYDNSEKGVTVDASPAGKTDQQSMVEKVVSENVPAKDTVSVRDKISEKSITIDEAYPDIEIGLAGQLEKLNRISSRRLAIETAMDLWDTGSIINRKLDQVEDDLAFLRLSARKNGFIIRTIIDEMSMLELINLPAVIELIKPDDLSSVYLALIGYGNDTMLFWNADTGKLIKTDFKGFMENWSGKAYIPWKNFYRIYGTIPYDTNNESILALKMLLQDIGYSDIFMDPVYDEMTQKIIMDFQEKQGIEIDGVVGSTTKMVLYNEKKSLTIPHIMVFEN